MVPSDASALSDARCHRVVKLGRMLCARSIKPLERGRPWLQRTRVLCKFNCGKERCEGAPRLCDRAGQIISGAQKLAIAKEYSAGRYHTMNMRVNAEFLTQRSQMTGKRKDHMHVRRREQLLPEKYPKCGHCSRRLVWCLWCLLRREIGAIYAEELK
jgi:hypothetical protein